MKLSLFEAFAAAVLGSSAAMAEKEPERFTSSLWQTYWPTGVRVPTAKPTSPCTGNTPDWTDLYGDSCEWYEASDSPGCPKYGSDYEGDMGIADDNCCYCFGTGSPVITPQPSPFPTPRPTVSSAPSTKIPTYPPWTPFPTTAVEPTPKPTSPCDGNTPNWTDSFGDGCEWYEAFDLPRCPNFGNYYEGTMGVPNDNCCHCFGTGAPVVSESRSPTPKPTSPCTGNTPDWADVDGYGCEWYEAYDLPGCTIYGNDYGGDMGVASANCCYCSME